MSDENPPLPGVAGEPAQAGPGLDVVPSTADAGQSASVAPAVDTHSLVVERGGLRGGRKRLDGLTPGSPEAAEADKRADAARKRLARARASGKPLVDPPPLRPRPLAWLQIPAGAPDSGPAGVPGAPGGGEVAWTEKDVAEITDALIDAIDEHDKTSAVEKLVKFNANISKSLLNEVEKDAEMPDICKKFFKATLPKVGAKKLNSTSLKPENKDTAQLLGAFLFYAFHKVKTGQRIKAIIKSLPPAPDAAPTPP